MSAMKQFVHDRSITLARMASKFFPDRVPVTLVGSEATRELCETIAQTRPRRVGLVTDEGLIAAGIVGRVEAGLREAGVEVCVFSGVTPDPTFPEVEEGLARFREEGCDAILAVGGGSAMDAAKVIAAAATNPGPVRKLEGNFKVKKPPLPLYALPTTAGTGSEVTIAAVVSEPDTHQKRFFVDAKLLPVAAALDPTLMTGLPPHITAATGMDALTHAVESVLACTATPQTESYARSAIQRVFPDLPTAFAQGDDLAARRSMALASYYAGLAFTRTSVGYVHAIAHSFGAFYGTPHGWANGIVLPQVLDFSLEAVPERMARMADWIEVGGEGRSDRDKAQAFVAAVRELAAKVQVPATLDALKAEDVPAIARQALGEAHANYPVPRYMLQDQCEELLSKLLS